ncbi:hypothetical protein [Pseudomonas sp. lyk4-TYG-107]|uniref:hypothetical protein n=1 Tax=Pseudomonas sp. lyk4-TYG-107 TaxID=3040317 RepID=UPI000E38E346|nr:hypothetical protein [Pseudomonas sp. lyk4-TYG-107]
MAVVLRSCIVCNTEFPSKNMRARFCKSTCKSIHHRATKKPETPTIKTEEVNTMSQLFQPDAAHLKRLQDFEVGQYNTRTQCNIQGREQLGVMEEFEVQGLQQALDRYVELVGLGYTATGEIAHLPKLIAGPTLDWVILSLRKPESQVEHEIAQIKAQVEQEYLQRLEADKAACVAKEVESLLAGEKRRKQQAEFDAKAAQEAAEYARVEAEVLAALGGKQ